MKNLILFLVLVLAPTLWVTAVHHYDVYTGTSSPLDAMNILLRELRREVGDIKKDLRSRMEVIKYELSCEIKNLKDELIKERDDGTDQDPGAEDPEAHKKHLKRGFRKIVEQGDEIKNELRSQKAELYAVRNSVYDSREDIIGKGNHILKKLQTGNESLTCHMIDIRKKLMKVNGNLAVIMQKQDRMLDAIQSRAHVRDFMPLPPRETFQRYTTTTAEVETVEHELKRTLPGCTINPLETQETLETFGIGHHNISKGIEGYNENKDGTTEASPRGKTPITLNKLFPKATENCNDADKKTFLEYPPMPRDCRDVFELGFMETGVYRIQPPGLSSREVFCDHDNQEGGWTVFVARRKSSRHISFNRTWHEYEVGFGEPSNEYWLGK